MATELDNKIRFQLRPTVVGVAIMDRLSAQGVDRNAESRRWMELGFAAEQAGFRLDGAELRHADRAWHVQPSLHGSEAYEVKPQVATAIKPPAPQAPAPQASAPVTAVRSDVERRDDAPSSTIQDAGPSGLVGNLRKLSA